MISLTSSASRYSPAFPGTRQRTSGPRSGLGYEIPVRRVRPTDGLWRASVAGRRHAGGDVQMPEVRPCRGFVDEPDGNAVGLVIGSRDRRQNRAGAAARNRPHDGRDRPGRCLCGHGARRAGTGRDVSDYEERSVGELRVRIDRTLCVGFGDCITEAPEAFVLDESGTAVFVKPDAVDRERLLRACDSCPVDAITVWNANGTQIVPAACE